MKTPFSCLFLVCNNVCRFCDWIVLTAMLNCLLYLDSDCSCLALGYFPKPPPQRSMSRLGLNGLPIKATDFRLLFHERASLLTDTSDSAAFRRLGSLLTEDNPGQILPDQTQWAPARDNYSTAARNSWWWVGGICVHPKRDFNAFVLWISLPAHQILFRNYSVPPIHTTLNVDWLIRQGQGSSEWTSSMDWNGALKQLSSSMGHMSHCVPHGERQTE